MSVNRVCVSVNRLVVAVCPLHRNFDRHVLFFRFGFERNYFLIYDFNFFGVVQIFDIVLQTALVQVNIFATVALVEQADLQTLVQETHLLKTLTQSFVVVLDGFENVWVCQELDHGSGGVRDRPLLYVSGWNTHLELLGPEVSVASYDSAKFG